MTCGSHFDVTCQAENSTARHTQTLCCVCECLLWKPCTARMKSGRKRCRNSWLWDPFPPCSALSGRPWGALPRCLLAARWAAKGRTSRMLSGVCSSCQGRPGRDQAAISGPCLDGRTRPRHRWVSAGEVSWQEAQRDDRAAKGDVRCLQLTSPSVLHSAC